MNHIMATYQCHTGFRDDSNQVAYKYFTVFVMDDSHVRVYGHCKTMNELKSTYTFDVLIENLMTDAAVTGHIKIARKDGITFNNKKYSKEDVIAAENRVVTTRFAGITK